MWYVNVQEPPYILSAKSPSSEVLANQGCGRMNVVDLQRDIKLIQYAIHFIRITKDGILKRGI